MIKRKLRNGENKKPPKGLLVLGGVLAAVLLSAGVWTVNALCGVWREQSVVTDPDLDVVVTTGKMIHQDVIVYHFGLTNGANIATIPFAKLRSGLLKKVPNIHDLKIERRLPNRVTIEVIEREPLVRIADARNKNPAGKVADSEGVVFRCFQRVDHLPTIRDGAQETFSVGKKLEGQPVAALHLVEALNEPEFSSLKPVDISIRKQDFLLVTFADASQAKIAWERMGENSRKSRESLKMQLTRLQHAMGTGINTPSTIWIATDWGKPGRVYANNPAFAQ